MPMRQSRGRTDGRPSADTVAAGHRSQTGTGLISHQVLRVVRDLPDAKRRLS